MLNTWGLVDFHCHLDLYPDHEQIVKECEKSGIFTLAVTTTPKAWPRNNELVQGTNFVRAALGLHPQLVAEREAELGIWDQYFPKTRYIGEVGLDASPRFFRSLDAQQRVFQHILRRCAESGDKIISVHSLRATKMVLKHVESLLPPNRGKVVLHWFTGSKAEAQWAVELGCYFSVNALMLNSDRHSKMVRSIPLERILTETDGPFTKVKYRSSCPRDVGNAMAALSDLYQVTPNEMAAMVRNNLKRLLD